MANHTDRNSSVGPFTAVAFLRESLQPIKSLAGFRKETHRVPESSTSASAALISQLATADLNRDLDQRFAALKSAYGFKRVELEVSGPTDGAGTIVTPYFTYHVQVSWDATNPADVLWQRRVTDIHQPTLALSDQFAEVFDKTFDTIEFVPADSLDVEALIDQVEELDDARIRVEYDRAATYCVLTMEGVKGELRVTSGAVKFHQRGVDDPRQLVKSLAAIQKALVAMQAILPLGFI